MYSHLFIGSEAETSRGRIRMESRYPWEGSIRYVVEPAGSFCLAIRIPAYVDAFTVCINGERIRAATEGGYLRLERTWRPGDMVDLAFDLPVRRIHADPRIRDAAGKVALARGPLVYCFESADQAAPLCSLLAKDSVPQAEAYDPELLGGIVPIRAQGFVQQPADAPYSVEMPTLSPCCLTAVPYYAWGNRDPGDMTVWMRTEA